MHMRVKEAVSPKTSEPNYSIINKNHNDQIQFPPEKRREKTKWFHHLLINQQIG